MAVLQKDIAKKLNMSVATVSRCLNCDPRISPATRAKVLACASNLGYRPKKQIHQDMMLSERAFGNSYTIAAIIQAEAVNFNTTPIGYQVLAGMSQSAHRLGISLVLHTVPLEKRELIHIRENQPRAMQEGKLDGAILVYRFGEESVNKLAEQIPCVSIAHYHPQARMDYVGPDNIGGICKIVEHLLSLGHKRLGYISHDYQASFFDERLSGFILGLTKAGISFNKEYVLRYDEFHPKSYLSSLYKWIDDGITAIVCANDSVAKDVYRWCTDNRVSVPNDISIAGFDNDPVPLGMPELTTIEVNFNQMGSFALEMLINRLDDPTRPPAKMIVDCKLKKGQTTKKIEDTK